MKEVVPQCNACCSEVKESFAVDVGDIDRGIDMFLY
jgi:hypothetical protein